MDIIVAAALIAVGIVVAAAVYARVTSGAVPTIHADVSGVSSAGVAAPVSGGSPAGGGGSVGGGSVGGGSAGGGSVGGGSVGGVPPAAGLSSASAAAVKSLATRARPAAGRVPPPATSNGGGREHSEELVAREQELSEREAEIIERARLLEHQREELVRELERIAGVSAARAKQLLIETIEDDARQEAARRVRQIEDDTRREAERRVRNILAVVMQRLAAGHAAETTVSVVQLTSDDMKGRIIGREGRNIRVLETLTGVDFIIDDTPGAVVLSGFDGVRREIARLTLERLLQDGRIHPARIEEVYFQVKSELETHIMEAGEQGAFEAGVQGLHPELIRYLGRLKFRTSYGQNVLAHSVEVAQLAAMMASELGASAKTARRAALLHDIGKAVTHEVEGPHARVGGELARKYGETEAVIHAMEAHHNEVEPQTVEAVVVQAADALSGARPGARGESLELYVKRLRDLEEIATNHRGVEKVYAMQAGREIRVIVAPDAVDDAGATLLSFEIARNIEKQLEYPGQIKVTVIRESRAVDYAR